MTAPMRRASTARAERERLMQLAAQSFRAGEMRLSRAYFHVARTGRTLGFGNRDRRSEFIDDAASDDDEEEEDDDDDEDEDEDEDYEEWLFVETEAARVYKMLTGRRPTADAPSKKVWARAAPPLRAPKNRLRSIKWTRRLWWRCTGCRMHGRRAAAS